jgi:hypothetical protein
LKTTRPFALAAAAHRDTDEPLDATFASVADCGPIVDTYAPFASEALGPDPVAGVLPAVEAAEEFTAGRGFGSWGAGEGLAVEGAGRGGALGVGVELLPGLLSDVEELIPADGCSPSSGSLEIGGEKVPSAGCSTPCMVTSGSGSVGRTHPGGSRPGS